MKIQERPYFTDFKYTQINLKFYLPFVMSIFSLWFLYSPFVWILRRIFEISGIAILSGHLGHKTIPAKKIEELKKNINSKEPIFVTLKLNEKQFNSITRSEISHSFTIKIKSFLYWHSNIRVTAGYCCGYTDSTQLFKHLHG